MSILVTTEAVHGVYHPEIVRGVIQRVALQVGHGGSGIFQLIFQKFHDNLHEPHDNLHENSMTIYMKISQKFHENYVTIRKQN
jgi:hypothetical protein